MIQAKDKELTEVLNELTKAKGLLAKLGVPGYAETECIELAANHTPSLPNCLHLLKYALNVYPHQMLPVCITSQVYKHKAGSNQIFLNAIIDIVYYYISLVWDNAEVHL
ncbi:hypothetical protein Fot_41393 [Forsythia ovata]|uniref:Uncharacterized protein n=1 Tax=Forsythia ovata TaxID=205694 RepID=A0ABD1RIY2_9LAMI